MITTNSLDLIDAKLEGDEIIGTPIGDIELIDTFFNDDASTRLFDEMDYQRAVQCYIWSIPLVSVTTWRNRENEAYGATGANDFVVLKSLKEKRGIVTGNLTTPYIFNFGSLKHGPCVVDYPAGKTAGGFMDFWQRPVADLGLTGPDQGNGATYIVVGPEHDPKKYRKEGVYVLQSATNNRFFGLRILDPGPAFYTNFKAALKMGRYGKPLEACRFIEDLDIEWSATAPRGIEYWKILSDVINDEPVREIDKPWIAFLLPLGIEKASPSTQMRDRNPCF
jgi:hypothetical protein